VARWERGLPPREDLLVRIRAVIEAKEEAIGLADVVALHSASENSGDLAVDDRLAKLRATFLDACVQRFNRGERLPESVLTFVVEQLGPKA
jgi:hypothetical protein